VENELVSAIGNPSPQQLLLIRRASVKAIRCALAERRILDDGSSDSLQNDYLKWSRELRLDLKTLGLSSYRQEKVLDLGEYLEQKEAAK
jgi:hypothetical protein